MINYRTAKNSLLIFFDSLGFLKKEYTLSLKNGLKVFIRPKVSGKVSDIDIFKELFFEDQYRLHKIIKPTDKVIIDIGAQIGIFSLLVSKLNKEGIVYAYEPLPINFSQLERNVKLNNSKNIKIFNSAVSNSVQKISFFVSNKNEGAHSIYQDLKENKKIFVNSTRLKDIIKNNNLKKIDLLKLDCEGAEYDILLNLSKEDLKKIDRIVLEKHVTPTILKKFKPEKLDEKLISAGFKRVIFKKISYANEGDFFISYFYRGDK